MTIQLSQEQSNAIEEILRWLLNKDEKYLILDGIAGTGKSTIINHLVTKDIGKVIKTCQLMGKKPPVSPNTTIVTATTNKAASLLRSKDLISVSTIHSALNLRLLVNEKGELEAFAPALLGDFANFLFIIDEYSMIGQKLFNMIEKLTIGAKILLVGDSNQLDPVKDKIPVEFNNIRKITLTDNRRTLNKAIADNIKTLSNSVKYKDKIVIYKDKQIKHFTAPNDEVLNLLKNEFSNNKDNKILTYTNKSVISYNKHIRLMNNLSEEAQVGDIIFIKNRKNSPYSAPNQSGIITKIPPVSLVTPSFIPKELLSNFCVTLENGTKHTIVGFKNPKNYLVYKKRAKILTKTEKLTNGDKNVINRVQQLESYISNYSFDHASTIHNAQGSTYESVFIDLSNISICYNTDTVRRLVYVAMSRAQNNIYLYGDLKTKQGYIV